MRSRSSHFLGSPEAIHVQICTSITVLWSWSYGESLFVLLILVELLTITRVISLFQLFLINTVVSFISGGVTFRGLADTEMFVDIWIIVLIFANDFSCYFCLSLCTKFCGSTEPMKTTKISIQQIKMNSLYNNTENINACINISKVLLPQAQVTWIDFAYPV